MEGFITGLLVAGVIFLIWQAIKAGSGPCGYG